MKERVAVLRCEDYEDSHLSKKIQEGIEYLGGWKEFISPGEKILLKPNLLVARPAERCVTTHPALVRAVARLLLDAGCRVVIGDSPNLGTARKVAKVCGIEEVARELGIEILEFDPVEIKFPQGKVFKTLTVGRPVLEVDKVINLPKLKTHSLTCLTLAVKNLFGYIPGLRKGQWHVKTSEAGKEFLAQLFLELHEWKRPALNIVDGIMAMEGRGPTFGTPRHLGLLVLGKDALVVDRIIAEIVSAPVALVTTLKVAKLKGYGYKEIDEIEIFGETLETLCIKDFKLPPRTEVPAEFSEFLGLPKGLFRFLKKQLTTQPEIKVELCQKCEMCRETCPVNAISFNQNRLLIDRRICIQCLCCMEVCPEGAIELKPGWLLKVYNRFHPSER